MLRGYVRVARYPARYKEKAARPYRRKYAAGLLKTRGVQTQKFSAIQTLLSMVGPRIATYFPLREGTAQLGQTWFTCQIWWALPAKSTYSKLSLRPAGLLLTKSPLESAAQSRELKPPQFFTVSSRIGSPESESTRIRLLLGPKVNAAIDSPSGESPQAQSAVCFRSVA